MARPNTTTEDISRLIQSREKNITHRANRVSKDELKTWAVDEVAAVLDQLSPKPNKLGSDEPCGPEINRSSALFDWIFTFVKAPIPLIRQSVTQEAALCVNSLGKFQVMTKGYAVMSHVWGETCGWTATNSWGPVEPALRKQGTFYAHFRKFFDRCEAEWLWVDILAMPEVFDDMTEAEKTETEDLRTGVINSLRNIYTRADKVVCLDGLLLRLHSGGMVDVAVLLCLGRWTQRLWPFAETKLAKRVVVKTEDSSFDLDRIIQFFYETISNDQHRYFQMFTRLAPLRPVPPGHRYWLGSPFRQDSNERNIFADIYNGCEKRLSDVDIDQAKALFPVLNLKWQTGWTLQQGLKHIYDSYPNDRDFLEEYCRFRDISFRP